MEALIKIKVLYDKTRSQYQLFNRNINRIFLPIRHNMNPDVRYVWSKGVGSLYGEFNASCGSGYTSRLT